ncbi:MAG: hypothetical protein ABIN67_04480 [Ferruginibacter sp.]
MKLYFPIILIYLSLSCGNREPTSLSTVTPIHTNDIQPQLNSQLPFLDTIIIISDQNSTLTVNKHINDKEAEKLLYDYFLKKGILSQKELQIRSTINMDMETINYDTIYEIHSSNLSGAVLSYWLGPVDLNGHCFQPSKAIILNTKKGYRIKNEGFIPTNFAIDSVKGTNIYGYDYECGGRGVLREFRVTLRW